MGADHPFPQCAARCRWRALALQLTYADCPGHAQSSRKLRSSDGGLLRGVALCSLPPFMAGAVQRDGGARDGRGS
jgi:hypothetical protein